MKSTAKKSNSKLVNIILIKKNKIYSMNEITKFKNEVEENIVAQGNNDELKKTAAAFMDASIRSRYSYNFTWLGRPIIQYPQDIVAIQEIIYQIQPDLIIETGIAHGGSLILHASICELIGKE